MEYMLPLTWTPLLALLPWRRRNQIVAARVGTFVSWDQGNKADHVVVTFVNTASKPIRVKNAYHRDNVAISSCARFSKFWLRSIRPDQIAPDGKSRLGPAMGISLPEGGVRIAEGDEIQLPIRFLPARFLVEHRCHPVIVLKDSLGGVHVTWLPQEWFLQVNQQYLESQGKWHASKDQAQ